ncbi:MAG: DNA mismatch repair protein MutS [Acholeplasmataceae bacterium]|jgi:DNA mismatch repair protein MutS|nr:DNA mismatch repair protein MutS [Acholeplasmataceae bacterium]
MDKKRFTPMMQQYLDIKKDYADAIVFFRLGDFYEMFFDDAILASKVLEIALTSRDAGEKVPMCGIPYHAAKAYIQKLIEKGFKIAIAEQVTEPGKGLVERKVIKIITPGTVLEDGILDANHHNFIASVLLTEKGYIVSSIDLSTGEAFLTDGLEKHEAFDLIKDLGIIEVVLHSRFDERFIEDLKALDRLISTSDDLTISDHKALDHLDREQKRGMSHLMHYIENTQKHSIDHLMQVEVVMHNQQMKVDYRVKKSLEITESLVDQKQTTLLYWLDGCLTAMGARMLKHMMLNPMNDLIQLNQRYDYIDALKPFGPREVLIQSLKEIYDLNRIVGRISFDTVNARDLIQLKHSLSQIPLLKEALLQYESSILKDLSDTIDSHEHLYHFLDEAIFEEPPISLKEGNLIKEGYDEKLDELRHIGTSGESWLLDFEQQEREKTGIKNLRVGYNRVFGYYIEVSKGNAELVKESFGYDRKQTLANSERFITPELKLKEDDILHALDRSIQREYELFCEIREIVKKDMFSLQELAKKIASIDVYLNLSLKSEKYRYVRPKLSDKKQVKVTQGRHPVVEHFTTFVKNDVFMNEGEIFLITGPNMSGKSTYMRMYALIVYMAQIGSFVPADLAELPLYDAIFTRIGSSDDLSGGKSTFMVEMVESNEALSKATPNSLVLFDEIGRGTATYDGMALAQGMIEYIHEKIKCQTFFSTHYHELTQLEMSLSRLTNLSVKAKEEKDRMIFLHHVEKGATDKSYGIQVASLAHLPKSLIMRSQEILHHLEKKELKISLDLFNYDAYEKEQTHVIDPNHLRVLEEIEGLNIDQLTPIEALLLLKHLQTILKK